MRPAIGTREQIHAHAPLLARMTRAGNSLKRILSQGEVDDPIAILSRAGVLDIAPWLTIQATREGMELVLLPGTLEGIPIYDEEPESGLASIADMLGSNDPEIIENCPWTEEFLWAAERVARSACEDELIETDGLTAWHLALCGTTSVTTKMQQAICDELKSAVAERRLPTGLAAQALRSGWRHLEARQDLSGASWPDGQTGPVIGGEGEKRLRFRVRRGVDGRMLVSTLRLGRNLNLGEDHIEAMCQPLPETLIASIAGQPIDRLIAHPRIGGWNLKATRLLRYRARGTAGKFEIRIETDRSEPERRLCFLVDRQGD